MSFGLGGKSKKEKIVAVFDIGSGSVGGAIVRMPQGEKSVPTIIKSSRVDISFHDELNFSVFLNDMIKALKETSEAIYNSKVGAPDEIVCVLASPWYLSETRIIKMVHEHSFFFTSKLADEMLESEIKALNAEYEKKYGSAKSSPEVIEHHIMGVSLNGYLVDEPLGMKSRSVEMHMAISLSPKVCLDKIRKTISDSYHHTPISFASFTLCSYLAVREKYVTPDSYLLLDIGGEVTDVSIITKGILKASLSFPFGKNTFFKYMCTKLEIEYRDAVELFNLYSTGALAERKLKKVEPLFQSIENSWGEAFRACIGTLPHTLTLPGTIFVTADLDIRDWFVKAVCNDEYIKSIVTEHKCTTVTLEGPEFLNMCSVKDGTCDPFLMIEAIGIRRRN